jgi:hypothetical protein
MNKKIQPKYFENAKIKCACGTFLKLLNKRIMEVKFVLAVTHIIQDKKEELWKW